MCAHVPAGAVAKRLDFPGSGEVGGFWNRGISACAVCDGAAPMFRKAPLAVIGGGDSAMEEALFLTKYGSKVYIIHRRDEFRASKIMQKRALEHPKIEVHTPSLLTAGVPLRAAQSATDTVALLYQRPSCLVPPCRPHKCVCFGIQTESSCHHLGSKHQIIRLVTQVVQLVHHQGQRCM